MESTLAVPLGDSLGSVTAVVAAMPAAAATPPAGDGPVAGALAWETAAVYKYAAKWLLKNTRMKDSQHF